MASTLAPVMAPDNVLSFEIKPGTLFQFLESRAEGGPRLKCVEGSVTLVSPGMPHESQGYRLNQWIVAVCLEIGIKLKGLASTTWTLPMGAGDTGYEADAAYYLRNYDRTETHQPPDLAIEIVVSHPATKALRAGTLLKIPELWVLDIPRHRLTFYQLLTRGKSQGDYRAEAWSRAFPVLRSIEVLERLDDPELDDIAFLENCRGWARRVLVPRHQAANGGA